MDFMHDRLVDGTKIRLLTVVDNYSRESVALEVDYGFKSRQVIEVLQRAIRHRGAPEIIRVDNGPEFISKELDLWAYNHKINLDFSRPRKPTDNAFIESFNNRVRQELLNPHWFTSVADARKKAAAWRKDYNGIHPHSSLGHLAPKDFARKAKLKTLQAGFSN